MVDHIELLRLIEKNARLTPAEIAVMLGADAAEVENEIARLTEEKIILGYTTEINWALTLCSSTRTIISAISPASYMRRLLPLKELSPLRHTLSFASTRRTA